MSTPSVIRVCFLFLLTKCNYNAIVWRCVFKVVSGTPLFCLIKFVSCNTDSLTVLLSFVCLWVQMKTFGKLKQLQRCVKSSPTLIWGVNWIPVPLALGDRFLGNCMVSFQVPPHSDYGVYAMIIIRLTTDVMMLGFWEMYVIYTNYNNMDNWCGISGNSIHPIWRVSGSMD